MIKGASHELDKSRRADDSFVSQKRRGSYIYDFLVFCIKSCPCNWVGSDFDWCDDFRVLIQFIPVSCWKKMSTWKIVDTVFCSFVRNGETIDQLNLDWLGLLAVTGLTLSAPVGEVLEENRRASHLQNATGHLPSLQEANIFCLIVTLNTECETKQQPSFYVYKQTVFFEMNWI